MTQRKSSTVEDRPRRTVTITGRPGGVPRKSSIRLAGAGTIERRRPPRGAAQLVGPRPDRVALWAVMMGVLLILVAISSG